MGVDYIVAVAIRYFVLLAVSGVLSLWVLPYGWQEPLGIAGVCYWLMIIQTEPSARYARRARQPWARWVLFYGACAHAFGGALFMSLSPVVEPRFQVPDPGPGLEIAVPWVYERPIFFEAGLPGRVCVDIRRLGGAGGVRRATYMGGGRASRAASHAPEALPKFRNSDCMIGEYRRVH